MADRLKVMLKPTADGDLLPILCDQDGETLPGQMALSIETSVDDFATVTATFGMVEFAQ